MPSIVSNNTQQEQTNWPVALADACLISQDGTSHGPADPATTVTLPGVAGATGVLKIRPRAAQVSGDAATPTANAWVLDVNKGVSGSTNVAGPTATGLQVDTIAAGDWNIVFNYTLSVAWLGGTFVMRFRPYTTNDSFGTPVVITLPGANANGWVAAAATTPGAGTAGTISWSAVGASAQTLRSSFKIIAIEFELNVTVKGTATNSTMSIDTNGWHVDVPALTFSRSPGDTVPTPTDAPTRQTIVLRTIAETLPTLTDAPGRTLAAFRSPADTLPALTDAPGRTFVGFRNVAETLPTPTDSPARQTAVLRTVAYTLPTLADSVARTLAAFRATAESIPAVFDTASRVAMFNRTITETLPAPTDAPARQTQVRRTVSETLPTLLDTALRMFIARRTIAESLSSSVPVVSPPPPLIFVDGDPARRIAGQLYEKV